MAFCFTHLQGLWRISSFNVNNNANNVEFLCAMQKLSGMVGDVTVLPNGDILVSAMQPGLRLPATPKT